MDYATQIGQKIKSARMSKCMSVKDLAAQAQITPSMLSQIERGQANPSLNTIRLLCSALSEPMFRFFIDDMDVSSEIVHQADRKHIVDHGVDYEMLSPDTNSAIEMMQLTLSPDAFSSDHPKNHIGEEITLVLKGDIELILDNEVCLMHAGDSVRIRSGINHCWHNVGEDEAVLVFAVSPPDF